MAVKPTYPGVNVRMRIDPATATGDILIRPGSSKDLAVPLMLGTAQGGLEFSSRWNQRPAPNGITRPEPSAVDDFALLAQNGLANIVIDVMKPDGTFVADSVSMTAGPLPSIETTGAADPMSKDANPLSPNGNSDGVREKLGIVAQRIAQFLPTVATNKNKWKTSIANYRLTMTPTDDVRDNFVSTNFSVPAATIAPHFPTPNVHYYAVGVGGAGAGRQTSASSAASGAFQGTTPKDAYFVKCDNETTTQNDRNLGIMNVWVGFAPLKPAEFVILYLQQMAGQVQV